MPFFDFHVHPSLKCMFSEPDRKTSPWEDIDVRKIPWLLRWCTDFEYILGSQANLSMVRYSNAILVCVALYVPERAITSSSLLLQQAKGTLQTYLNPERLEKINQGILRPYPDLVYEDLDVLHHPEKFGIRDKKIVFLSKEELFDEHARDAIYVVFSIEGCHTLSGSLNPADMQPDELIHNLEELRLRIPVISLNLTHLEQYPLCNHAYGIQFVSNEYFKPTGNRITNGGVELISYCYEHRILIDLKHMSLGARLMLMRDLRTQLGWGRINQPLVCTHAGFTGISIADIPDYMQAQKSGKQSHYLLWGKPKKYGMLDFFTAFNPSSINVYDEEILAILESGGMIGLSLDKRILGYTEATNRSPNLNELVFEEEYISTAEAAVFLTKKQTGSRMTDFYCATTQDVLQGGSVLPRIGYYHLCHFMQHVLHFMKVAIDNGYPLEKALTQICIGSDFDGIIDPLWCSPAMPAMMDFKLQFADTFMSFAHQNVELVQLPHTFDIEQFTEQLFYLNGRNFVLQRIQLI